MGGPELARQAFGRNLGIIAGRGVFLEMVAFGVSFDPQAAYKFAYARWMRMASRTLIRYLV